MLLQVVKPFVTSLIRANKIIIFTIFYSFKELESDKKKKR